MDISLDCVGFCRDCGREHRLPAAPALDAARALMDDLARCGHIGLGLADDPWLDLGYVDGPARGQMFGVLVVRDGVGDERTLKAFSGQYNGVWEVPGWVPPILDPAAFADTIRDDEPRISALTARLAERGQDDPRRKELLAQRLRGPREPFRHPPPRPVLCALRGKMRADPGVSAVRGGGVGRGGLRWFCHTQGGLCVAKWHSNTHNGFYVCWNVLKKTGQKFRKYSDLQRC